MNSQNPFPSGDSCCGPNNDMTVDQLLGNAYQVVKFVAMRMPYIKTLSDNIDDLIALAGSLEGLNDLAAKLPELMSLQAELQKLIVLYDNLSKLVLVADNMTQILTVHDNLPQIQTIVDNLTQIQTVVSNIANIVTVANNIAAVNNVHNNMSALLNVNTNMAAVNNVSTNMTDVRAVATNMPQVSAVGSNIAEILAVYSKLDELTELATELDATLAKFTDLAAPSGGQMVGTPIATTMADAVIGVPTMAALRALPVPVLAAGKTVTISLLGFHEVGDGGGGQFYWKGNSNQVDDGGTVISPDGNPATGRWLRVRDHGYANVRWFGAKGNGVAESAVAFQKALDSGIPQIEVPSDSEFVWAGNGPTIKSKTYLFSRGGVIRQPEAHIEATSTVGNEFAALRMDLGFSDITIDGLDIRGPFFEGPVTPAYRSIGISVSGRYDQYYYNNPNYPANPDIPVTGTSKKLTLLNLKIDGFGQSGVIVDQVDDFKASFISISNCCRDGIRTYGTYDGLVTHVDVATLGPGMPLEGTAPNNNMYGVEFTRIYHSPDADGSVDVYRPSRRCTLANSKFRNIPGWKGAGTHGGTDISFVMNEFDDCHIGIGIDKGGYNLADGFAPPRRISLIGNRFDATAGVAYGNRAAIACYAHDDTEDNIGEDLYLSGNRAYGPWGEDTRDGAIVVSNYRNVQVLNSEINGALRSGINFQNTVVDFRIAGGVLSNIQKTSSNVCVGVNCQGTKMRGMVDDLVFAQPVGDTMTALSSASQLAGYAVELGRNLKFSGSITKVNSQGTFFGQDSPFFKRTLAWVSYNMAGGTVPTVQSERGVASLSLIATGQVRVTMREPATTATTYVVNAVSRSTTPIMFSVVSVSATEFDILTFNQAGAAANSAMQVEVVGY
ncbi:putative tail fiber protein [Achromobacter phage vB_AxyP_19-32_Axy04]|uniref:Putative tail fiber protein n=1 Tax=Achromobacter phage vB_AxyP_19-32_Axy04 TaxID=2591039 RepID=A0A514CTC1_9CAUD|nr:appendage [Achromobacter phage vB_AxyP_19-32_Axy04]QDH83731.1 putative tail fiber protein [Achromobacter phage vB_AxyP_19-32_Axy04]